MKVGQQLKRFQFMELLLYWEGGFTKKQLIDQFNISRQQVTSDIQEYSRLYHNILITSKNRHYVEAKSYSPSLISSNVDGYLNWLHTEQLHFTDSANASAKAFQLSLPNRNVSPIVIQQLIQAIRQQKRLEVDYVSLSNPERDGRIFHPHTFVNTGIRWHVRGYCEKSQGFRDLVLTRFYGAPAILDNSHVLQIEDHAWNTEVNLILKPDPRLTPEKQSIIAADYNMQAEQLVVKTKAALANYALKAMQVSLKLHDTPEAQQLVLVNKKDIDSWLYD